MNKWNAHELSIEYDFSSHFTGQCDWFVERPIIASQLNPSKWYTNIKFQKMIWHEITVDRPKNHLQCQTLLDIL